ncbi:hypothetical protein CLOP_g9109 [Closterium sp. NIES-67]|nr:hypothetical protein CLOP_g9109 [Closterium sp. NIES-67]
MVIAVGQEAMTTMRLAVMAARILTRKKKKRKVRHQSSDESASSSSSDSSNSGETSTLESNYSSQKAESSEQVSLESESDGGRHRHRHHRKDRHSARDHRERRRGRGEGGRRKKRGSPLKLVSDPTRGQGRGDMGGRHKAPVAKKTTTPYKCWDDASYSGSASEGPLLVRLKDKKKVVFGAYGHPKEEAAEDDGDRPKRGRRQADNAEDDGFGAPAARMAYKTGRELRFEKTTKETPPHEEMERP